MKLWQQILVGMVLGVLAGALLGDAAEYIKPLGLMFINLIKMIIVPLIFFSLVSAMTGMDDIKKAGRIGLKSFGWYLFTTAFAIALGLAIASFFDLGGGIDLNISGDEIKRTVVEPFSFSAMLIGLIPVNPVQAMAEGNVLQIIVFAILFGMAINAAGDKGVKVAGLIDSGAEVTYKLTGIIMKAAPFGVFALMAWLVGTQDGALVTSLVKVVVVIYAICIIHALLVYGGLLYFVGKVNPVHFFRKIVPAQIMAYTTSSSSATLPVTMQVAGDELGVSKETASFTLPLGTTVNMDGTALYQGVCALFVAQAMGIDLVFSDYITIILTATLASIGSAGVPGAGLIMLSLVLQSIGLPIEGVAIIAGIDRILDMARTTVNVTGDLTVAVIVDKTEGNFDGKQYVSVRDDKKAA